MGYQVDLFKCISVSVHPHPTHFKYSITGVTLWYLLTLYALSALSVVYLCFLKHPVSIPVINKTCIFHACTTSTSHNRKQIRHLHNDLALFNNVRGQLVWGEKGVVRQN